MEKKDIIAYFDSCAQTWDENATDDPQIIEKILDNAQVCSGLDILDVACGTGVMIPYYLKRDAASITAIDISPEMVKIAGEKYGTDPRVQVICGDVEDMVFQKKFDRIVVYNALPHFQNPKHLIRTLAEMLKENGRLTIAHGASRDAEGTASKISAGLMDVDKLKKLFDPRFHVEVMISDSKMYQVSGVRKDPLSHVCEDTIEEHIPLGRSDDLPLEELLVLMRYLVSHNDAHAQEIADLASQLRSAGKFMAYRQIMDTVAEFDVVNAKLDAVLKNLLVEEF